MKNPIANKSYKRLALILSLVVILLWATLGTGMSIAWFSDTSPKLKNVFHFADFDLTVRHRLPDMTWEEIDAQTRVFDDEALYEPGYVQVVYLCVENNGTLPFNFETAVSVTDYTPGVNAFGQAIILQDYLRFGLVFASTEAEMDALVSTREAAVALADIRLSNYAADKVCLAAGDTAYMALVVRMPTDVGNVANYRGDTVPRVELGVIVNATQTEN
ncbi:MAG: hypothetical protein IJU41_01575 [Clostridia bacterium]|nr:hypothetical protein [Clostridia bacterium]